MRGVVRLWIVGVLRERGCMTEWVEGGRGSCCEFVVIG